MSSEIVPFIDEGSLTTMIKFVDHLKSNGALPSGETSGQLLMKLQAAKDMGLTPTQAINGIGFVNGKLTVYGSAAASLMIKHNYKLEWLESSATTAKVKVSKDDRSHEETYTIEDARKANLATKPGPWTQYPKDMLRWKALSRARNFFCPEVAGGMPVHEDYQDIDEGAKSEAKAETLAQIAVAQDLAPFSKMAATDKEIFEAVSRRRKELAAPALPAVSAEAPEAEAPKAKAKKAATKEETRHEQKEVEAQIIDEPLPERKEAAPVDEEAKAEPVKPALPAAAPGSVFKIPGSKLESVVKKEDDDGKRASNALTSAIFAQWNSTELSPEDKKGRTMDALANSVKIYTGKPHGDVFKCTPTEGEMILSAIMLRNTQLIKAA